MLFGHQPQKAEQCLSLQGTQTQTQMERLLQWIFGLPCALPIDGSSQCKNFSDCVEKFIKDECSNESPKELALGTAKRKRSQLHVLTTASTNDTIEWTKWQWHSAMLLELFVPTQPSPVCMIRKHNIPWNLSTVVWIFTWDEIA